MEKMINKNKLIQLSEERKVSRYRVSKATGILETYINNIFNGKQVNPTVSIVYKLAKYFGTSIEELLKEE
ncbi:hypothetical protein QX51_15360 [Terrisporobacter othiniensis]|uniref:HTH cro/C1-type domain-containing protein n=1 Tax=Terrisporobacter othiniensis TaxID=1577792 RepID=A0A0B3WNP1_9FIRM|nr:helix-turn-helix transcriptional regulator [Terrisporobacter othiniensis]KHS56145.1 hypothetical protein QX51_15360 [Terrisporobacter othiniensis]